MQNKIRHCLCCFVALCFPKFTPMSFFRAFSFKKKSSSGTTKVEVKTKVISSNVLANRNVNVPKNSLVTKSPLTFSNKLERPQKSKINNSFPVSSKGKLDSPSPAGNCSPAVSAALTKDNNQFNSGNSSNATNLDASLGFPMDDWDDLDDFETPAKGKSDSFCSDTSAASGKPMSSPCKGKGEFTGKVNHNASVVTLELSNTFSNGLSRSEMSCKETNELEYSVNKRAASPGPGLKQDPEFELEDSPVRVTSRRLPSHLKSVMSDSEEDSNVMPVLSEERTGKVLFVAVIVFHLYIEGGTQKLFLTHRLYCIFVSLDEKKKWIDPKVIELDNNSEPEDDLDYIPPSPIPDEISYTTSTLKIRSAFGTWFVNMVVNLINLKCEMSIIKTSHSQKVVMWKPDDFINPKTRLFVVPKVHTVLFSINVKVAYL